MKKSFIHVISVLNTVMASSSQIYNFKTEQPILIYFECKSNRIKINIYLIRLIVPENVSRFMYLRSITKKYASIGIGLPFEVPSHGWP